MQGESFTVTCGSKTGDYSCRYTEGVVRLLVATGDRTAALKALVALGKVKLLTDSQVWGE